MNFKSIFLLVALFSQSAFAQGGSGHVGGGGDAKTEMRIDEIRVDILKWILDGGAKGLNFPADVTYENYIASMTPLLQPGNVVVTAVLESQENLKNEELNVRVDGQPKTCKGFKSKIDQKLHLICSVERFAGLSEAEQYRQIHHEYAGLALVEKNIGAASDYALSTQLTNYLHPETIMRLGIKPNTASVMCPMGYIMTAQGCVLPKREIYSCGVYLSKDLSIGLTFERDPAQQHMIRAFFQFDDTNTNFYSETEKKWKTGTQVEVANHYVLLSPRSNGKYRIQSFVPHAMHGSYLDNDSLSNALEIAGYRLKGLSFKLDGLNTQFYYKGKTYPMDCENYQQTDPLF